MGVTEQNAGKEVVSQHSPSCHCQHDAATLRDKLLSLRSTGLSSQGPAEEQKEG
ncbi:hypothetical protein LEMLEM_LOCUS4700 [Lemmus lemmus]